MGGRVIAATSVFDVRGVRIPPWLGSQLRWSAVWEGVCHREHMAYGHMWGSSENGSAEPGKEKGGMRGMVGEWCPAETGVAEPRAVAPSAVSPATPGEEEAARVAAANAVGIVASSAAGGGITEKWETELPPARVPRWGSAVGAGSAP